MPEDENHPMDTLNRLTYLTRYYYELQSVRFAPVWLGFLCLLLFQMLFAPQLESLGARGLWTLLLGLLTLQVLWYWLANRYYKSRFGWLKPDPLRFIKQKRRGPLFFILFLAFLVWATVCRIHHSAAFVPYLVPLLLGQLTFDTENPPLRRIYFGAGCGLIVASVLLTRFASLDGTLYFATLCGVLLALGLADHLLLMSLRTPPQKEADA